MLAKLYIALLLLFSSSSCSFQTIITFSLSLSLSLALPELCSLHLLYLFSSYSRKRNMVRKRDRFWEYAEDLKGRFKCKFCERDFAGGASRIKCHLAGVKGHDIDICTKVSKEVQEEAALIVGEPNKKLKGASTSNRDKGREINSTSISKDVTLSRVFEKMVAILQRVLRLTQKAGEKFAFGKIIKLMTTVAKAVQGVVI